MKGVKQLQIYLINHAQKHGPKIFCLGVKAEYYVTNYNCSTTPEFVELLKSPKKPDKLYSIYPQVLSQTMKSLTRSCFAVVPYILNVHVLASLRIILTITSIDLVDDPAWSKLP